MTEATTTQTTETTTTTKTEPKVEPKVEVKAEGTTEAEPKEQTVPFSRFQSVIAQKAESERARQALERELKLANDTLEEVRSLGTKREDGTTQTKPVVAPKALSADELQRLVSEESTRQQFDQRCNASVAEGRKVHTDFDKVVLGDLTSISPIMDQRSGRPVLPVPLVEAALETGNAHEVLYALGKDVAEASRIMALRPTAQAVALARFAEKLGETKAEEPELDDEGKSPKLANVSRAPAPIKAPSKPGGTKPAFSFEDTENFSTEEWIRQREKHLKEKRAAH